MALRVGGKLPDMTTQDVPTLVEASGAEKLLEAL